MQAPHENWFYTTALNCKKDVDILHDLLLLIENIVQGNAFVSAKKIGPLLEYKIQVSTIQPTFLVVYEEKKSAMPRLTHFQNDIKETAPHALIGNGGNQSNFNFIYPFYSLGSPIILDVMPSVSNTNAAVIPNAITFPVPETNNVVIKQEPVAPTLMKSENSHVCNNVKLNSEPLNTAPPNLVDVKTLVDNPDVKAKFLKVKTASKNLVLCRFCHKKFYSLSSLSSHERIHTGEKPFSCKICRKSFCHRNNMRLHMQSHIGVGPYSCDHCEKLFSSYSKKVLHDSIHTGKKPFPCSYCDKTFTHASYKKRHERSHMERGNHACSYCGETFIYLSGKIRHEKKTHIDKLAFYCQRPRPLLPKPPADQNQTTGSSFVSFDPPNILQQQKKS